MGVQRVPESDAYKAFVSAFAAFDKLHSKLNGKIQDVVSEITTKASHSTDAGAKSLTNLATTHKILLDGKKIPVHPSHQNFHHIHEILATVSEWKDQIFQKMEKRWENAQNRLSEVERKAGIQVHAKILPFEQCQPGSELELADKLLALEEFVGDYEVLGEAIILNLALQNQIASESNRAKGWIMNQTSKAIQSKIEEISSGKRAITDSRSLPGFIKAVAKASVEDLNPESLCQKAQELSTRIQQSADLRPEEASDFMTQLQQLEEGMYAEAPTLPNHPENLIQTFKQRKEALEQKISAIESVVN